MTRFGTFAVLYLTALFLELAEQWRYPVFTFGILLLGSVLLFVGITRKTFLVLLAVATAHALLVQFPDVANHVNVEIACNVLMMVGITYSLIHRDQFATDDEYFEMIRPVLQATMILVYALAGFHKLNADFFDPAVSCVGSLVGDLSRMTVATTFGIPVTLVLVAGVSLVPSRLMADNPTWLRLAPAARLIAIGLVAIGAMLALDRLPALSATTLRPVILTMAVIVVLWELVGGLLLAVPRFQAPLLVFCWTMHATLSLIGFVDFGALALALLFTFGPRSYQDLITSSQPVTGFGRPVHRVHVYFALNVLAGLLSSLDRRLAAALLFNASVLILLWPMLAAVVSQRPRPAWRAVGLANPSTPRWLFLFPALLALHGLTPYLGLRTAGNFSMFSNLRTEGPRSNHFLLRSNPRKVWSYQEDVVRFIRIDDRRAAIGYNYQPLRGNELPVVEFRKLIYAWTRAGATVPLTFEYAGRVYHTDDIVRDPVWRTTARTWEMRLMDFRVIQPPGPNHCRW